MQRGAIPKENILSDPPLVGKEGRSRGMAHHWGCKAKCKKNSESQPGLYQWLGGANFLYGKQTTEFSWAFSSLSCGI